MAAVLESLMLSSKGKETRPMMLLINDKLHSTKQEKQIWFNWTIIAHKRQTVKNET